MTGADWRDQGLCAQVDPELWFPEKGGDIGANAKRVCAACPVVAECLEYAVTTFQRYGVWGGKSDAQLVRIRVQRGIANPAASNRVPVDEVYRLSDLGWQAKTIAVEVGAHVDTVRRVLKQRREAVAA
jgi:WhiB family redox-sensing transcriptional regulator